MEQQFTWLPFGTVFIYSGVVQSKTHSLGSYFVLNQLLSQVLFMYVKRFATCRTENGIFVTREASFYVKNVFPRENTACFWLALFI